jgi:hypothetical protein
MDFKVYEKNNGVVKNIQVVNENNLEPVIRKRITQNYRGISEIFEDIDFMRVGDVKKYTPDTVTNSQIKNVGNIAMNAKSIQDMFAQITRLQNSNKVFIYIERIK